MVEADKKAQEDTKTALLSSQASQITALQQQLSQLANQFQAYITAVHGTNASLKSPTPLESLPS
jgi:hypothetical protein